VNDDRGGQETVFEVHPGNWPVAVDATDPRNQFHERALHEARIATDYRQVETSAPARAGLVSRLRLALGGGSAMTATEPCSCAA
jgi:hypothetical protein